MPKEESRQDVEIDKTPEISSCNSLCYRETLSIKLVVQKVEVNQEDQIVLGVLGGSPY